jgi:L-threonylcarbamoyladenylate synthase
VEEEGASVAEYVTEILPAADAEAVARAAALLRTGETVAFPTETVYGLGADALNPAAVRRVFAAKGRPADNPLIVHVAEPGEVTPLVRAIDDRARALMARFWPGPLTLVLPKSGAVPGEVTAGLDSVGVRLPAHPAARALIRAAGVPVAAPSANRSGRPSPTTAHHVYEDLSGRVPLILDGGDCAVGVESTVLDLTEPVPVVLRPGGVTPEMLRAVLGEVRIDRGALAPLARGAVPRSPGMKYRHYAPEAAVVVVTGGQAAVLERVQALYDAAEVRGERAAILAPAERCAAYGTRRSLAWGARSDPHKAATELFAALRELDAQGVRSVFAEAVPTEGIGLAVMNRLCRAAGFHVEQAD